MKDIKTPWDFVEKYYPNYYGSDEIAYNDDLSKLIHKEQEDGDFASELLKTEYDNDIRNPKIQRDYNRSMSEIYETAIEYYLKEQQKSEGLEIQRTLILSTGHLPFKELKDIKINTFILGNGKCQYPFRTLLHEYGMQLNFMEMDETTRPMYEKMYNEHPYLSKIYSLMQANGIKRVDFDQDGEKIEGLMYFDW